MANSSAVKDLVRVRNVSRNRLRITGKNIKNTVATLLDFNLGAVRREMARYNDSGDAVVQGATGVLYVDFAGVVATTGGAIASVALPEKCIIKRVFVDVKVASAGAATIGVAVGASATAITTPLSATATTNINAQTVGVTAVEGAAGGERAAGTFVNVQGSATTASLVGALAIEYIAIP